MTKIHFKNVFMNDFSSHAKVERFFPVKVERFFPVKVERFK